MSKLVNKFQNWLNKVNYTPTNSSNDENQAHESDSIQSEQIKTVSQNVPLEFNQQDLSNASKIKIYENESIIVYIEKTIHRRLKRFKFLDNLFQIKIETKNESAPLLSTLLETFEMIFKFIINHIRTFFKPEDHNIAYLTVCQDPMINGINTG